MITLVTKATSQAYAEVEDLEGSPGIAITIEIAGQAAESQSTGRTLTTSLRQLEKKPHPLCPLQ